MQKMVAQRETRLNTADLLTKWQAAKENDKAYDFSCFSDYRDWYDKLPKQLVTLDETHHKTKAENLCHHWCNELLKRYDFENVRVNNFYNDFNLAINTAIALSDWYSLQCYCKYIDLLKGK